MSLLIIPYWYNGNMESKNENEGAAVIAVSYKPLDPIYKPIEPTEEQKRKLYRLKRKKRS